MTKKTFPLNKRFSAAISDTAYAELRKLNERYHFSNNYLLTVLLENLEKVCDQRALDAVFKEFTEEFGAPAPGKMKK